MILHPDGTTETLKRRFRYFILSNKRHSPEWLKLSGQGFFQYMKLFDQKGSAFWKEYKSLTEKFVIHNDIEAARVLSGVKLFDGLQCKELCILAFDIETNGLAVNDASFIYIISCVVRKNGQITQKLFNYDAFQSQAAMLRAWVAWVNEISPHVMSAYNGYRFDWPFILRVAKNHGVKLTLGRDGSELEVASHASHFRKEGGQQYGFHDIQIFGRDCVDAMFLVMKADQAERRFESYALKSVIKTLGLERENRQHFDASSIQNEYKNPESWVKIQQYAIDDALDALVLLEKYLPPYFAITKIIPKSLQQIINGATGSQINSSLIASYLQMGHSIPKSSETAPFEGGMTFSKLGLFKRVFRADVSSLYPSVCIQWNIHDPLKDPQNHFIQLLSEWTKERLQFKALFEESGDENAQAMSGALKILINSAFGAMATRGLNFNSQEKAEEITKRGREILAHAIAYARTQGFEEIYGDTDSLALIRKDQDMTKEEGMEFLKKLNEEFPSQIRFHEDGFFDRYLIISTKNYATRCDDKITIKGASLRSAAREFALREFLERAILLIMKDEASQLPPLIAEYESEIDAMKDHTRWAARKTITEKVIDRTGTTQKKISDAIQGSGLGMGDKVWVMFREDQSLVTVDNWANDHCKKRLKSKLKETFKIIRKVIPC